MVQILLYCIHKSHSCKNGMDQTIKLHEIREFVYLFKSSLNNHKNQQLKLPKLSFIIDNIIKKHNICFTFAHILFFFICIFKLQKKNCAQ